MIFAFYNNKGGVGKTTTAINAAYTFAKQGHSVLVADCDRQQNAARFLCDSRPSDGTAMNSRYDRISVFSCTRENAEWQTKLRGAASHFDIVLLDMPPALTEQTNELLAIADSVIVPIELGSFAIQGITAVTAAVNRCNTAFLGCLVTRFDRKNSADVEMLDVLQHQLGNKLFDTIIPQSKIIRNSISFRMTASEYMGWLQPAKTYDALTAEMLRKAM